MPTTTGPSGRLKGMSEAPTAALRDVYFISDSTGISAEMLGNALLANFPGMPFRRHTIPFIETAEAASVIARAIREAAEVGPQPVIFTTVKSPEVRAELAKSPARFVDLLSGHLGELEETFGVSAVQQQGQFHTVGELDRYFERMRAVEYAIEHDDGQSRRALEEADVIIVAPSRCGKTPTTMYLALQYGLLVANYPLTSDDVFSEDLPPLIRPYKDRCFGLTTTPQRLHQVREARRPNSTYASLAECTKELRRAEELYEINDIPYISSATKSVEEMSAVIIQKLRLRP